MSDQRPLELYDTKTNPRVRWSCRRCNRRNDAPISLPVLTRETKHCKFCRLPFSFALTPTVKREPLNVGDWVQVTRKGFKTPSVADRFRLTGKTDTGHWFGEDVMGVRWGDFADADLHLSERGTPPEVA